MIPPVEPQPKAYLAATQEPSGEIRVALKFPARNIYKPAPLRYDEYGMPQAPRLVYCVKVGEKPSKPGGFGFLPRKTIFTKRGRRNIKSICGAMERRHGKNVVFGTFTLAGSTDEAMRALAEWSGKAVELLRKWLHYHVPGCDFVWVWELQRRGALHLHLAVGSPDAQALTWLIENFQQYAHKLQATLSRLSGTDVFARVDGGSWRGFPEILRSRFEWVKKSVKRYMAKYLSKGSQGECKYFPSRWWGGSEGAKALAATMRSVTIVRSDDWNYLVGLFDHIRNNWSDMGFPVFCWCAKYAPHNKTVVAYPCDDDDHGVGESLVALLENLPAVVVSDMVPRIAAAAQPF